MFSLPSSSPPLTPSPKLTLNNGNQGQREEFIFVYEEDKRPVVILLGWAGCQDRYLAKYSAIYEEKSCITLRYTAPVDCLFWRTDRIPQMAKRLIQMITEKNLDQHPIFFHIFSNGGAFIYQHISIAMKQANSPLKVKGVIFDSAPGERRLITLFRAVSAIIGGHPLTNIPLSFVVTVFLSILWHIEVIQQGLGIGAKRISPNPFALTEEESSWPQLFLYSNVDNLIPAADIEKFARRRAELGVQVQLVLFTNSPHVKHYATYRDVYVNTVVGFIHQCLTATDKSNEKFDEQKYDALPSLPKRIVLPHDATKQEN